VYTSPKAEPIKLTFEGVITEVWVVTSPATVSVTLHETINGTLGWNEMEITFGAQGNDELCRIVGVGIRAAWMMYNGAVESLKG